MVRGSQLLLPATTCLATTSLNFASRLRRTTNTNSASCGLIGELQCSPSRASRKSTADSRWYTPSHCSATRQLTERPLAWEVSLAIEPCVGLRRGGYSRAQRVRIDFPGARPPLVDSHGSRARYSRSGRRHRGSLTRPSRRRSACLHSTPRDGLQARLPRCGSSSSSFVICSATSHPQMLITFI